MDLTRKITELLDRWPSAGLAVAVVRPAATEWFLGRGVANVASKEPITDPAHAEVDPVRGVFSRATGARAQLAGVTTPRPAVAHHRRSRLDAFLLSCGLIAPLLYVAIDIFLATRWEGYSYRDQTISELNAIGAPTRTLSIVLGITGYAVLVAFGLGVWRSAAGRRSLRVAGGALTLLGVLSWFGVPLLPMHVRGAEQSLTDTLHVAQLGLAGPLLFVIIGCGAAAFGRGFRLYSAATVVAMLTFGAWSGTYSGRMIDGLETPWMGVLERISVYSYQLWFAVFALVLIAKVRVAALETSARCT